MGNVLIRANFGLEPEKLSLSQWSDLCAEAQWLEQWRLTNKAEMLVRLLGGGFYVLGKV
jgi:hypothetical protein